MENIIHKESLTMGDINIPRLTKFKTIISWEEIL